MLDLKDSKASSGRRRGQGKNSPEREIDRSLIHLLHRASQRASEVFASKTRNFDLTVRQYAVIATIASHAGLSQSDLVRLTGIDRSTLADVVQRLERRGIIERQRMSRDGRAYAVHLTEAGHRLLQSIKPSARRADRAILEMLGEEDGKLAAQILSRFIREAGEVSPRETERAD